MKKNCNPLLKICSTRFMHPLSVFYPIIQVFQVIWKPFAPGLYQKNKVPLNFRHRFCVNVYGERRDSSSGKTGIGQTGRFRIHCLDELMRKVYQAVWLLRKQWVY